jgi:hypothetical protein
VRIEPENPARDPAVGWNWRVGAVPSPGVDDRVGYAAWLGGAAEPDADGDGLANVAEYMLGGNNAGDSSAVVPEGGLAAVTVGGVEETYMTLSVRLVNGREDFRMRVEFSGDLASWPTAGVQIAARDNGDGTRTELWRSPDPVLPGTRRFGRVRFTPR